MANRLRFRLGSRIKQNQFDGVERCNPLKVVNFFVFSQTQQDSLLFVSETCFGKKTFKRHQLRLVWVLQVGTSYTVEFVEPQALGLLMAPCCEFYGGALAFKLLLC